uniref:dermonecrotic toxin domain-containing protein n=1 Tax=Pseudomonas viridiflava TaxID=33069 RepID=UPI00311AAB7B
ADLQKKVMTKLDDFWSKHGDQWEALAKKQFVMEANSALALNQTHPDQGLTPQVYASLMKAAAPDVPFKDEGAPAMDIKVLAFDINGYRSNDILRFVAKDGGETLYFPGEKPALISFKDRVAMDQ